MTPPIKDENFRFDSEFVKMIATQAEQKVLLNNLEDKIGEIKDFNAGNFENINKKLEILTNGIASVQSNCIAHKVLENQKEIAEKEKTCNQSGLILGMKPDILKGIVLVIIMVIGYFLGVPLPK
jgi:phage host-nuclease inhibitor protein Gam